MFALILKLLEENMLGIIKNIEKGLIVPPVKYSKKVNCKISSVRKIKDIFSSSWFFLKK